jgi:hypothetical protein
MGGITIGVVFFGGNGPNNAGLNTGALVTVCLLGTVLGILLLFAGLPNRMITRRNPATGEERLCFPDRHPNARWLWGMDG